MKAPILSDGRLRLIKNKKELLEPSGTVTGFSLFILVRFFVIEIRNDRLRLSMIVLEDDFERLPLFAS